MASIFPTRWLFFIALVTSFLSLATYQYSLAAVNNAQDIIEDFINESYVYQFDSLLSREQISAFYAVFNSAFNVLGIAGPMVTPWISDRFGRRTSLMILATSLAMVAGVLQIVSYYTICFELLIIGRGLMGFVSGSVTALLPVYLTECSAKEYRGSVNALHTAATQTWSLVALALALPQLLGTAVGWPYLLSLPLFTSALLFVCAFFFPETPQYLYVRRNEEEKARQVIRELNGPEANVDQIMEDIRVEALVQGRAGFAETVKLAWRTPAIRKGILLSMVVIVGQLFSGITMITSYSTTLFEDSGLSTSESKLFSFVAGVARLSTVLVVPFLIDRVGRKPLLLGGLGSMTVANALFAAFSLVQFYSTDPQKWIGYVCVVLICIDNACYSIGPSPIPWFISTELTPVNVRAVAGMFTCCTGWTTSFVLILLQPILTSIIGPYTTLVLAVIPCSIIIVILYFNLPETKLKTVAEILMELDPTRRDSGERTPLLSPYLKSADGLKNFT